MMNYCSKRFVVALLAVLLFSLSACSPFTELFSNDASRFAQRKDGAPVIVLDAKKLRDAVPRIDPITAAGNTSPYTVFGKTYTVMASAQGYQEQGLASWYGTKFHSRKTANGERYDMYAMTAAHKTLPIPCYVKVTNLENNRSTVVRVNDRGPFYDERIIDLSYAASVKLGYADKGTANVRIEIIEPAAVQAKSAELYLQAGAYDAYNAAHRVQQKLREIVVQPISVLASNKLYKVHIGPLARNEIEPITELIKSAKLDAPQLISVPK